MRERERAREREKKRERKKKREREREAVSIFIKVVLQDNKVKLKEVKPTCTEIRISNWTAKLFNTFWNIDFNCIYTV